MNTISTLIPRQNCPNNPVHFIQLLQISDFCGTEIVEKAAALNIIFEEYITD